MCDNMKQIDENLGEPSKIVIREMIQDFYNGNHGFTIMQIDGLLRKHKNEITCEINPLLTIATISNLERKNIIVKLEKITHDFFHLTDDFTESVNSNG